MNSDKIKLTFTTCILIDKEYWFTEDRFSGLFAYDPVSGKIRHVHTFSSIKWNVVAAFADKVIRHNNELFFFPCDNDVIVVYNMETRQDKVIKIDGYKGKRFDVTAVVREKDKVLFASGDSRCIYELDLNSKLTKISSKLSEAVKNNPEAEGIAYTYISGELWLAVRGTNILYHLNQAWEISEKWFVPCHELKISSMAFDGELLWFAQRWSADVVSWNKKHNEIKGYEIQNHDWLDGADENPREWPYHNIVIGNGEIILVNSLAKYMLKFIPDREGFVEKIGDSSDIEYYDASYFREERYHGFYQHLGNEIWTSQILRNKAIKYNLLSKKYTTVDFRIDKTEIPDYKQELLKIFDDVQMERYEVLGLEELFGILDSSGCKEFVANNVGGKIYDHIMVIN